MPNTKLTALSPHQVEALNTLLTDTEKRHVTIEKRTATFAMSSPDAYNLVTRAQRRAPRPHNAHPYKSLHSLLRQLAQL